MVRLKLITEADLSASDITKIKNLPSNIGDVSGPNSATDGNFASFDLATGKLIKDSGKKASDFQPAGSYATGTGSADGINTGDNATNSQYSGLASSKQDALGFTPENVANKSTNVATDGASDTKYPSVKAIKDYADSLVAGLLDYRGGYDASVNTFPASGGSGSAGAVLKGDMWIISVAGTLGGTTVQIGDSVIANVDTPGQTAGNWNILNSNISYVPEDVANKENTTLDTSTTKYPTNRLVKEVTDSKIGASSADTLTNKTINADNNTIYNLEVDNLKSGVLDTDLSSVSANDDTIPSAKATKTALDLKDTTTSLTKYSNLNAPEGFLINGKIVPSVTSNNLTVAIKGMDGNDPSASNPVYIRINNVVRVLTSALNASANAGFNYLNMGSAALATKEVDLFVYLQWDTVASALKLRISRIPYAVLVSDTVNDATAEKGTLYNDANYTATDSLVNIGRFAATLSAGAGYTWTVPTFTSANLIQRPIFMTRLLDYIPVVASVGGTITSYTTSCKYQINQTNAVVYFSLTISNNGTGSVGINFKYPMTGLALGSLVGREQGVTGKTFSGQCFTESATLYDYANAYPASTGSTLVGSSTYPIK